MTDDSDYPRPPSPVTGLGCGVGAAGAFVAFVVPWIVGGTVTLVLAGVGLLASVVMLLQRGDKRMRTAGAALLGALVVPLLLFGACFKAVEGI